MEYSDEIMVHKVGCECRRSVESKCGLTEKQIRSLGWRKNPYPDGGEWFCDRCVQVMMD